MRFRWHLFVAVISIACGSTRHGLTQEAAAAKAHDLRSASELKEAVEAIISHPRYASAVWGVKILSLPSGKTLFEHNPRLLLSPASNSKLFTVALALDRLGEDYRIKTSLYAAKPPGADGTLDCDLIVYGRGDPTFNGRLHGGKLAAAMQELVSALTNAGVKRITGKLLGDCSFFHGPELGSGWTWDDQEYYYGAEICALSVNDNTLVASVKPGAAEGDPCVISLEPAFEGVAVSNKTLTVASNATRSVSFFRVPSQNVLHITGAMPLGDPGLREDVTIHDPAMLFAQIFARALRENGVELTGKPTSAGWLQRDRKSPEAPSLTELGFALSPPLRELAREILKPSQNLYTDLVLAHAGERLRRANTVSERTSEDLGIADLNRFVAQIGIERGQVLFEEGSGLSRNNLTTADAIVKLLAHMSRHETSKAYIDALPVASRDGTLRRRMTGTPAAGNVKAKTGTLRWANALSGYVTTAAGEPLVFSLIVNRFYSTEPGFTGRTDLDRIAALLASVQVKLGDE